MRLFLNLVVFWYPQLLSLLLCDAFVVLERRKLSVEGNRSDLLQLSEELGSSTCSRAVHDVEDWDILVDFGKDGNREG
jgi:hypothetical protein